MQWIIAKSGSDMDDIKLNKFNGDENGVAKILLRLADADRQENFEDYDHGTEDVNQVEHRQDGSLYAYTCFFDFHRDYVARVDQEYSVPEIELPEETEDMDETEDIFENVIEKINDVYAMLKQLPKPERSQIGGTYYGGTQLLASVGNHLDLLEGEQYTSYGYGCNINYSAIYGIRLGGAYKTDIIKELSSYLKDHAKEINAAGYSVIDDYGTNFSVYGIARR